MSYVNIILLLEESQAMMGEAVLGLQLHYYLKGDENHSMNATIHNECERCFVQCLLALNKYVNGALSVEIYATEEVGGIRNKYRVFINGALGGLTALASVTQMLSYFGIYFVNPNLNNPTETLTRIEVVEKVKSIMASDTPFSAKEFAYIASNDRDLKKLKSEYFKTAIKEPTIESIEVNEVDLESNSLKSLGRIDYDDFVSCIIPKEEDIDSSDIEVVIYIVSPVLIKGRGDNWRGICNGVPIDFKVTDKEFLESVYDHSIRFTNGTYIVCRMRIIQKVNLLDNSLKISREVYEVKAVNDDDNVSFKKISHRRKKDIPDLTQLSLFDESHSDDN